MIVPSIFLSILLVLDVVRGDDCQYATADGSLDLRTFGDKDRPKYSGIHDSSSRNFLTYSFNGCFPYSTKDTCQNAAACVTDDLLQTTSLIARQAGRIFTYNHGLSTLLYTDGANTKLQVFLVCGTTESIEATKTGDASFLVHIESKCACPGKCTYTPEKPSNGLTGGTVFLIILLSITTVYLVGGVLFRRFVKQEQGLNLIPHRTLWLQIGSNSIHGVRFVLSKITRSTAYERV